MSLEHAVGLSLALALLLYLVWAIWKPERF